MTTTVEEKQKLHTFLRKVADEGLLYGEITPDTLNRLCALGMIGKHELEDGKYYYGDCRNANTAMWDTAQDCFVYQRTKFNQTFPETIKHPSDDDGFDVFLPIQEL